MSFIQNSLQAMEVFILHNPLWAWVVLAASFVVLAKCADIFVDSSIAIAVTFRIPKLVIGLVLVSLATTAPELTVSVISAFQGNPEMALGNAIGSVICDDGLALALAGLLAAAPIVVFPRVFKTTAIFLICVEVLAFLFVGFDYTLSRLEGVILVLLFFGYIGFLFYQHKKGSYNEGVEVDVNTNLKKAGIGLTILLFILGLAGLIGSSEFVIISAKSIAYSLGIPESIIALLLVALGTSIPEVATCVASALKKEGSIAVGNILGADIMNICWVGGASAIVNDLKLDFKTVYFMFPAMFAIVGVMLLMIRFGYKLTRLKAAALFGLYTVYIVLALVIF